MSQDSTGVDVSLLPPELWDLVYGGASQGVCMLDNRIYSPAMLLETIAKNPGKYAELWKTTLAAVSAAGVTAVTGSTLLSFVAAGLVGGPIGILATLITAGILSSNRSCTILILNLLSEPLKLQGNTLANGSGHGVQTGYPVFKEKNMVTGVEISSTKDTIPGVFAMLPGAAVCGLGVYRFEKDLDLGIGVYGTEGAISFVTTDPKTPGEIGVAWCVPQSGDPCAAVTMDVAGEYGDLKTFYEKTVGAGKSRLSHVTDKNGAVHCSMVPRALEADSVKTIPSNLDKSDLVLTVAIRD